MFCFRNLFHRKARTALCIMGVALATAFVVAVGATTMRYTAVIREMNVLFNGQVLVVDKNSIVIQAIPIGTSMLPQSYTIGKIQNITGVEKLIPILFVTNITQGANLELVPRNFSIGIPVENWESVLGPTPLKGSAGYYPMNESGSEVVVGVSLADQYDWTVGTELTINGYRLNVSGVLDTRLAVLSRSIVMPLQLAQKVYNHQKDVNMIAVKPAAGYSEKSLAEAIKQEVGYVNALTEDERFDMIQPVLIQVETWNLGIEAIIFTLSLILVMTVTIMNVSERRRDFATLDAIGIPLNYVFRVVMLEASLIGIMGGVLGVIFGSLGAVTLGSLYTNIPVGQFFSDVFIIVPPLYMAETFAAIVIVCCVSGVIPALNASRMRIAETMRAEY
ncbi:ABC transporter permease [Candidatus Bathyarchaeota archaeon]|nr:ABC transporter permease [Candidatus Bathyarchaeota archaeon]